MSDFSSHTFGISNLFNRSLPPAPAPQTFVKLKQNMSTPNVKLQISNITSSIPNSTFQVIYTSGDKLKIQSLNSRDILITGPGPRSFKQFATLVDVKVNRAGRRAIATYQIKAPAPRDFWSFVDNGLYKLFIRPNQVSDRNGNSVQPGLIGKFRVIIPDIPIPPGGVNPPPGGVNPPPGGVNPPPGGVNPPPAEQVAPTAALISPPTITDGSSEALFTVTYADNVAVNVSTLDSNDIVVTGPNGFQQTATLVSVDAATNGTPRTATYRIIAPGTAWNASDNGSYAIAIQPGQVKDTSGNAVVASNLGSFQVALTTTNQTLVGTSGDNTVNGGSGNDTVDYSGLTNGIVVNLQTGRTLKPIYGGLATPKILPLGDSITAGQHTTNPVPGAYRIELYKDYTTDGFGLDFIGSKKNGPSTNFDQDHEGNPGFTIDALKAVIDAPGYFNTYQPDAVLLLIGTNDTGSDFNGGQGVTSSNINQGVDRMISDLSALIDDITSKAPNATVIVSSIPPLSSSKDTKGPRSQVPGLYNARIPTLVNQKQAAGQKVIFANVGGSLKVSDLTTDGIHPTAQSYNKLGDLWYQAIADRDVLNSIENVVGTPFNDTLIGSSAANVITGAGGADTLTGGGGADTFVYQTPAQGSDFITDFGLDDILQISASGFGGGLTFGTPLSDGVASSTGVLVNGSTPVGTSANFLYSGGVLSFDADGINPGSPVAIATLSSGPATLNPNQFTIVAS
jgi:Ca2+-binding RTX toxin-like protein